MSGTVHVFLFDGYADWEPALALAELRRSGGFEVRAVGVAPGEVVSMGGVRARTELGLEDLRPDASRLLILPGGDAWERGTLPAHRVIEKVLAFLDAGVPVGAICGAVAALARGGALAERRHTSNDRGWLRAVAPEYEGAALHQDELAVRDRGLVTAAGTGSVAFASELLAELAAMSEARRAVWTALFSTGRFPPGTDIDAFFAGG